MKLQIGSSKEIARYLVRMQSRIPRVISGKQRKGKPTVTRYERQKAISVRVDAHNIKEARELALKRKKSMTKTATYRVLSVRKMKSES